MIPKLKFPEEYIQRGNFTLSNGRKTKIFYDVNSLITEDVLIDYLVSCAPDSEHYVGIATAGAIMGKVIAREKGRKNFSMVKDGMLKYKKPEGLYVLIEDVTTTGSSLINAIRLVGHAPKKIFVCVDRRLSEHKTLEVISAFEI